MRDQTLPVCIAWGREERGAVEDVLSRLNSWDVLFVVVAVVVVLC
jgi:hypothetical protein